MGDIQLLVKVNNESGGYENIFPQTYLEAVKDKQNGITLKDILAGFNMLFLSYNSSKSNTRLQVASMYRRTGLWITYVLLDKTVVTEWYAGEAIDDDSWGNDSNWRNGSNALVGDISISTDGYWVINGVITDTKAQGEQGITPMLRVGSNNYLQASYTNGNSWVDASTNPVYTQFRVHDNKLEQSVDLGDTWIVVSDELAYKFRESGNKIQMSKDLGNTWEDVSSNPVFTQFRVSNNKLQQSTDLGESWSNISEELAYQFRNSGNKLQVSKDLGVTWEDTSDYIAAWFKFTGTTGSSQADNVGKIQISRDNGVTWSDLSGGFTNSLHIKGYVATIATLPSSAVQGDIYGVGPTYDPSDTGQTNPIYQLYVKDSTGWVNNGKFTSIAAGVVQTTGTSTTEVMSQNAVTEAIHEILYDVSANNNGAVFESLSVLLSNINLATLIPPSARRGGMTIRFIQGSVPNSDKKYVQYRYMGTAVTGSPNPFLDTANWQGVDATPTFDSGNLVESGGTFTGIASASENAKSIFNDITSGAVGLDAITPTTITGVKIDSETGEIIGGQSADKTIYYFEASDFMFVSVRLAHYSNFNSIFAECDTIPDVGIEVNIKQQFTSLASHLYEWNPTKKYVVVYSSTTPSSGYFRGSTPLNIKDVKDVAEEVKETIDGRNVDLGDFTEFPCNYNFNNAGIAISNYTKYATLPVKANTVVSVTYGDITVPSICCCLINKQQALKENGRNLSYSNTVSSAGLSVEGDNTIQKIKANTTLVFTPEVDCWLYLTQGENDEWWPESITVKKTETIVEKIEDTNARIDEVQEEIDAFPEKTTISSILSPDYFGTKTKTETVNIYSVVGWNGSYIKFSNKRFRVGVKVGITSERTEGTYKVSFKHTNQMNVLYSPTLDYNEVYFVDLGEYTDMGTQSMPCNLFLEKFNTVQSHEITATLYGVYVIDADTFEYVEGYQNVLDYDEQETVVYTNAMKSAHASTADFATESTHSNESDLSSETNRVRTAYEGKRVGLYGDSLVTYTSSFYGKYFKPLGMTPSLVGSGGGQCNNRGKNGFCTMERLALLPKNMKVLCFWGGVNDGNYFVDRTQPDWIDNAKFGTIDDEPLGVADMFNYHLTVENMDDLNTPGVTQTFFQAYKTLLRNISLLFPHTLLVCVTQYRAYYYDWRQGKDTVMFRKHWPRLIAAEKACCEEYSVPVCDLYTKAGVNDSNCFTMLNDDGGSLIHPFGWLGDRCVNLIAQSVKENMFLVEPTDAWTYNLRNDDKDVRELKEYLVDLRSETEINYMTLEEAIQGFISYTTEKSITLKNNMYLVFYNNQYGNSVGYFLIDYINPSSTTSWQKWEESTVYDMRQRDVTLAIDYGVQTLSEAIASFAHKATVEQWTYNNNMYMYFLTDINGSWSMYRLSTPSAPSSTSSWTFVKSGQTNT